MSKIKPLYLLIAIIVIILIILVVIIFSVSKTNPKTENNLSQVGDSMYLKYIHLNQDENEIYYFDDVLFNFYKIKDGRAQALTDSIFLTVKNVLWSKDNNLVLIKALNYPFQYLGSTSPVSDMSLEENKETWWIYDFSSQEAKLLKSGETLVSGAIFSPDSQKLSYSVPNSDQVENSIFISNIDGSQPQKIMEVTQGIPINWSPDGENILIQSTDNDQPSLKIFNIEQNQEIANIKYAQNGKFSPDSKKVLFDYTEEFEQQIPSICDLSNPTQISKLNLETDVEKIIWYNDQKLLVSIPAEKETLYLFDPATNKKEVIASFDRDTNPLDLLLTKDKKTLYFVSNNLLYKLKL